MRVLVVLPTFNEAATIANILDRVRKALPDASVLVVDDNSPDGTARIAAEVGDRFGNVDVLARRGKLGLGSAYRDGFGWGLERGYEAFVEMDSDFSHDPDVLPTLIAPAMHIGPLFLAGLILTCLTFAFLGVLAALLARSHEDMATFGSLILMPMTFLGGTFFSLSQVPLGLKYALYILPLTHASLFLRAVALDQPLPWTSFLALAAFFVIFLLGGMMALKRASV